MQKSMRHSIKLTDFGQHIQNRRQVPKYKQAYFVQIRPVFPSPVTIRIIQLCIKNSKYVAVFILRQQYWEEHVKTWRKKYFRLLAKIHHYFSTSQGHLRILKGTFQSQQLSTKTEQQLDQFEKHLYELPFSTCMSFYYIIIVVLIIHMQFTVL